MTMRTLWTTAVRARSSRRAWPVVLTVASVATGMAFGLLWAPLTGHGALWVPPGDIWSTYRGAHFVGWGDLGGIYGAGTRLVSFPGILFVLAPVAMLTSALGMTESFPMTLAHPSAWLVLGPVEILVACVALFSLDALAERLGVSRARRRLLCVAQAAVLWDVSVMWGHPEDAVAVGLAVYALVFALDDRFAGAGWLFGAAVATQPLVLLMAPVLAAMAGHRRLAGFTVRALAPAAALLAVPLLADFRNTVHALVDQPNFPLVDHMTPWTALAPRLGGQGRQLAVAAGPGRLVAVVLAAALGVWVRRWTHRPDLLVWACAAALALRCFTESVMVPFYVWPALAIAMVACAAATPSRMVVGSVAAILVTVYANFHFSEWLWWLPVTFGVVVVLAVGWPAGSSAPAGQLGSPAVPMPAMGDRRVLIGTAQ
jgi:hypothetical protein